jgi:hypothetical protein
MTENSKGIQVPTERTKTVWLAEDGEYEYIAFAAETLQAALQRVMEKHPEGEWSLKPHGKDSWSLNGSAYENPPSTLVMRPMYYALFQVDLAAAPLKAAVSNTPGFDIYRDLIISSRGDGTPARPLFESPRAIPEPKAAGRQILEELAGAGAAKAVYDAGYVCVPRKPTSAMVQGSYDALDEDVEHVWSQMIGVSEGYLTDEGLPVHSD